MLEIHLVLKNIRNQVKQYFVYFAGIIMVMSLLITYLNFSSSIISSISIIGDTGNIYMLYSFIFSLVFISILIFIFLLFILIYGNKMMSKLKAREYGLYKLYGISNKRLFRLIFLEQMTILIISFIISLIIGLLLTMLLVFLANLSIKDYLYDGFTISLSLKNYFIVLIVFVIEGLITSYLTYKKVREKEVVNLLNEQTDLKPVKSMNTVKFLFYLVVCVIIYSTMLYALDKQTRLLNLDEILLMLVAWCVVIYLSYKVLAYLLLKILPKKILYKKENIFTVSIISRKLSSSLKTMTFITIFLMVLFTLIFLGSYIQNMTKMNYQQADVIIDTNYSAHRYKYNNKEYTFNFTTLDDYTVKPDNDEGSYIGTDGFDVILESDVNRFLKENNFKSIDLKKDESIVVNPGDSNKNKYVVEDWEGNELFNVKVKSTINLEKVEDKTSDYNPSVLIVSDENIKMQYYDRNKQKDEILKEYEGKYDYDIIKNYIYAYCDDTHCYNYVMISESDMNKYFKAKSYDINMDLDYGEFGLVGVLHDNNEEIETWKEIGLNDKFYPIVQKEKLYISTIPNGSSNYVVISDEQVDELENLYFGIYELEFISYKEDMKSQDKEWINLDQKHTGLSLKIKSQEITNLYLSNMIAMSFTTFISFIILILLICILAMQTTIDSIENKREFHKLKNINYTNTDLRKSVNKITFVYFITPFIVAMINIYILSLPFRKYLSGDSSYILQFMDYKTVIYILIMIVIIYILFFLLINYSYKKVVIPKK